MYLNMAYPIDIFCDYKRCSDMMSCINVIAINNDLNSCIKFNKIVSYAIHLQDTSCFFLISLGNVFFNLRE